ncbi:MAG: 3-phosphoserine/phosphohydroxythreonine transaminase [Planctomycetaceae bacterium]|jgi:phosphoserine aminotransferase|nr:3-phosphoserine/phosphohydroxythreonine transaminase [Planctomycetaceae bacterium]
MQERVYNFSAGPAVLPLSVLRKAQEELLCLPDAGCSVLEVSHRARPFDEIIIQTETNIRKLLNVPDNYRILFLQGGALLQFAMIPMNFLKNTGKKADYLISGTWSKTALGEAKTQGETNILWDGAESGFRRKPKPEEYTGNPEAAYCYTCSNETIQGVQWREYPDTGDIPLVCDASSDIFSRSVDISRFGIYFACAQKNAGPAGVTIVIIRDDLVERSPKELPKMLNYKVLSDGRSMVNTPPCFAVYMVKLVTEWLLDHIGGLEKMEQRNAEKAKYLYDVIDRSHGFYRGHADKEYRSMMNVPFVLPSEELTKKFLDGAKTHHLTQLSGHRSVGGCRASIYNAMPEEGVLALRDFMLDFARKNG